MSSFDEWFKHATGNDPLSRRFAQEGEIPQSIDVPTGGAFRLADIERTCPEVGRTRMDSRATGGSSQIRG